MALTSDQPNLTPLCGLILPHVPNHPAQVITRPSLGHLFQENGHEDFLFFQGLSIALLLRLSIAPGFPALSKPQEALLKDEEQSNHDSNDPEPTRHLPRSR